MYNINEYEPVEIGAVALSYYLSLHKIEKREYYWTQYPQLLDRHVSEDDYRAMWRAARAASSDDKSPISFIMHYLYNNNTVEVGDICSLCLSLALIRYIYPTVGRLYSDIGHGSSQAADIYLAMLLYFEEDDFWGRMDIAEAVYRKLEGLMGQEYPERDIFSGAMIVDRRLASYIYGRDDPSVLNPFYINEYIRGSKEECIFYNTRLDDIMYRLERHIERGTEGKPVIILQGRKWSGRKYLAAGIGDRLDRNVLYVDIRYLLEEKGLVPAVRRLFRELLLSDRILCITGLDRIEGRDNANTAMVLNTIVKEYDKGHGGKRPLIITATERVKAAALLEKTAIVEDIPIPDMALSEYIWNSYQDMYLKERLLNGRELASKMKLTIGQIQHIVKMICVNPGRKDAGKLVYELCYSILDDGRLDGIKRVDIKETLDDIQLPEDQKEIIRMICNQVSGRLKVMDDWNLKSRFGYGTGTSALFAGPPGTGKTMAARIVAGSLGLELYQIDLSQVVDKYVGETEKKLEEIFRKASQSNMVLFFDEADALIGKRSEVKDSNDKYANVEVAYLLQRIEQYEGVVIMATNYMTNLDAALLRRIRFVVRFQMPDRDTREKIWRGAIPKELPVNNIDFEYLRDNFEFSGAQIKNVILNAAFMAAAEDNEKGLGMEHIVKACKIEITKEKAANFALALGKYSYLA